MNKIRKGEVKIYKGKEYIAIPEIEEESCKYMDVDDFVYKYNNR